MTSFERPDAGLLVEHLLPSLLGATHSLSQDLKERNLFFGELGTTLEALRGRLTVISSPPHGAREDPQYPWLWRYVSHFNVGSKARAVQHSKLWAFHWKVDRKVDHIEMLELHVSSTNLTTAAFRSQLQAGWQVRLRLDVRATQSTRKTWGMMIPFLDALGASAGSVAAERLTRLVKLLGRVDCPAGVTFVASVPGQKSAARQLREFTPSEVHVLTPTVGDWNKQTLKAWSADVGVARSNIRRKSRRNIHLKWISESHPWAQRDRWALSTKAKEVLEQNDISVECLPDKLRLAEEHQDCEDRWSHAKLYLIRSRYRHKWRLLVTSANWSASAWGAGPTAPRNFELGVVFDSEWTKLKALRDSFNPPETIPFCVDRAEDEGRVSALEWAEASWDGRRIALRARSTNRVKPICAVVTFTGGKERRIQLVRNKASMSWKDAARTPFSARFTQGSEALAVDVLDLRSPSNFAKTPLPEVDPSVEKALREAFLLQRYGGPVVDPESIPGLGGERGYTGDAPQATDYTVQTWIDARAGFCVVDKWRAARTEATADARLAERIRMDGAELRAYFAGREDAAAQLVAEELGWWLRTNHEG